MFAHKKTIKEKTMPRRISGQDWNDLLTSIELNDCILILGPNLSGSKTDETAASVPLIRQFAHQLAQLLSPDKVNDPDNLSHVAEVYIRETNNLTRFKGNLQAFYSRDHTPSPALENLTHLPFRLIINAAPDDLLCKAYLRRNIHFRSGLYNFDLSGMQEDPQYDVRNEAPFVYHLFGNYASPGSVVLTESQQVEFMQQIVQKEHKIPNSIQTVFRESKNYLFLGFDFSDWYLRLLLSVLNPKEEVKIPVSFALHNGSGTLSPAAEVFFGRRFKVGFFDDGAEEFTAELRRRWEEKKSGKSATTTLMAAGDTTNAVLLFANEDAAWQKTFLENAAALPKKYRLDIGEIAPGDHIETKLRDLLQSATVVIPLVTASFVREYYDLWEQQLLPLQREGKAVVVPVLAEATLWESLPGIEAMPVLPRNKKPVSSWDNAPEAWRHIMAELSIILENRRP